LPIEPPPLQDKAEEKKCHYPNTEENRPLFRWRSGGSKSVKRANDNEKQWTRYYRCETKTCDAKYKSIPRLDKKPEIICSGAHNHEPPRKPERLHPDIQEKIVDGLKMKAKPGVIHSNLINEASVPLQPGEAPDIRQIYSLQQKLNKELRPTSDTFANLLQRHEDSFLRHTQIQPFCLVFISEDGCHILKCSKVTIVDGTFDIGRDKYILTTVMAYYSNIAVPCAFMLSTTKDEFIYSIFFQVIKKYTNGQFVPDGVLMDFEVALGSAWSGVFPECSLWRDFFHFKQAILKKLRKEGHNSMVASVEQDLHTLWHSPTPDQFSKDVRFALDKWRRQASQFADYFQRVWLARFDPATWAKYGRPKDAPSGSNDIEAYNHRLQTVVFTDDVKGLEKITESLWKEVEFFSRTLKDRLLLEEKQKRRQRAIAQHLKRSRREEPCGTFTESPTIFRGPT
jgi:hypothetical protein